MGYWKSGEQKRWEKSGEIFKRCQTAKRNRENKKSISWMLNGLSKVEQRNSTIGG